MNYQIVQVNQNTWRIEDNGVRVFLLAGEDKALLIDSGMQLTNARDIAEFVYFDERHQYTASQFLTK